MSAETRALLPLFIVALFSVVIPIQIAIKRSHITALVLACVGLVAGIIALPFAAGVAPTQVSTLLVIDHFALFFSGIVLVACLVVALLAYDYLNAYSERHDEFYALLLLAAVGSMTLGAARHMISLFLGLEVLSVSLYVMIAYMYHESSSLEAGIKYLVLAAASSAFLLFGFALIYAASGTMEFGRIGAFAQANGGHPYLLIGMALFLVGAGYKLAAVPFHMWTPDIYQGAPAPVTTFVATVPKAAMMAALVRFLSEGQAYGFTGVTLAVAVVSASSMILGNLLALLQSSVKRLLAYSSIAHIGYMLVAVVAGGSRAVEAVAFYMVAYVVTSLGAFGIISLLSVRGFEPDLIDSYRGLFWRRPWLTGVFTAMLLSLAGIPLTAGFVGKFLLVSAGVGATFWTLVILLVLNSAVSLYYYLRVVVAMFSPLVPGAPAFPRLSISGGVVLCILILGLFFFGVYPEPLLRLASQAAQLVLR